MINYVGGISYTTQARLHYNQHRECYNTSRTTQRFSDSSNERYSPTHHGRLTTDSMLTARARV